MWDRRGGVLFRFWPYPVSLTPGLCLNPYVSVSSRSAFADILQPAWRNYSQCIFRSFRGGWYCMVLAKSLVSHRSSSGSDANACRYWATKISKWMLGQTGWLAACLRRLPLVRANCYFSNTMASTKSKGDNRSPNETMVLLCNCQMTTTAK